MVGGAETSGNMLVVLELFVLIFATCRLGELKIMAGRIFEIRDKLKQGLEKEGN